MRKHIGTIIYLALLLAAAAILSGCAAGLDNAGYDTYTVRSFRSVDGMPACCELDVKSGKEYAGRSVQFQTNGAAAVLSIQEMDAKAVKGQALAVKALTVLPVTGLTELLKGQ